jgi:excisionase family DNA binding protein
MRKVPKAPKEYLTITEAAKRLGISRQTIFWLVRRGRLRAMQIGGTQRIAMFLVQREDVLSYEKERSERGAKQAAAREAARAARAAAQDAAREARKPEIIVLP